MVGSVGRVHIILFTLFFFFLFVVYCAEAGYAYFTHYILWDLVWRGGGGGGWVCNQCWVEVCPNPYNPCLKGVSTYPSTARYLVFIVQISFSHSWVHRFWWSRSIDALSKGGGEIPDEVQNIRGLVMSPGEELCLPSLVRCLLLVFNVYQSIRHGLVGAWRWWDPASEIT